ncbi:hypothetical protein AB1Y20_008883 [Prymnesium parvum]|uniref:DH domain-containing protein n=1 Tax=Prymnesium parvum TaxID=97485 RepID=A0AB34IUL6_PRYPA
MDAVSSEVENLCEEVRLTEATYVEDLRAVLLVYVRPARKLDILSLKEKEEIFSNLEELLVPAEALLERLSRTGEPVATLADAFIAVAPFFRVYSSYCKNYSVALQTVRRCREAGAFEEFLNSQSSRKESKGLTLEAFLIKPVQRLTKYPLFFQSLLKNVPKEHSAYSRLQDANELVKQVSKSVDASLNGVASGALMELLKQLRPEFLQLVAPHRQLIGRHDCCFVCNDKSWPAAALFVMSDLLLVCKRKGASGAEEHTLSPKLLLRLDELLVGDEAAEGSRLVASQPGSPFHLPLAWDRDGRPVESFRVECASSEALAAVRDDLDDTTLNFKHRRSDLRQRQVRKSVVAGDDAYIDELIFYLDKLRGVKPQSGKTLTNTMLKSSTSPALFSGASRGAHAPSSSKSTDSALVAADDTDADVGLGRRLRDMMRTGEASGRGKLAVASCGSSAGSFDACEMGSPRRAVHMKASPAKEADGFVRTVSRQPLQLGQVMSAELGGPPPSPPAAVASSPAAQVRAQKQGQYRC